MNNRIVHKDGRVTKVKNFRVGENRGITLVVLVITIVVMLIITTTVISLSTNNLKTKHLSNMYTDIKSLDDKVAVFYNQYGTLPLKEKFTGSMQFQTVANPNDDLDGYYVIDVNKLNNLILTKKLTWQNDDVYIINTKTHTIYYPHGVTLDSETYYRLPGEYSVIKEPENIEGEIAIAINPSTPTNKDVTATITWASGNYSATKEISTNGGTTYTEYKGDSTQISISENCVIKARIRKESEEIKTSSLEVSNIDKTNPIVTPKQSSVTITEGDSNTLGNYFTIVANGKYGISSIVYTDTSNNNMTITNTNTLTEGSHIIKCTATKETGATASATMTIVVKNGVPTEETEINLKGGLNYITIPKGVNIVKLSCYSAVEMEPVMTAQVQLSNVSNNKIWALGPRDEEAEDCYSAVSRVLNVYIKVTPGKTYTLKLDDLEQGFDSLTATVNLKGSLTYSQEINKQTPDIIDL